MDPKKTFLSWPVVRQLRSGDLLGRGPAVTSAHTRALTPRTATADRVVQSVCPYCAVGCGQRVFVKDEQGRPDRGRPGLADLARPAVPQGLRQRAAGQLPRPADARCSTARRAPRDWEPIELDTAVEMVAQRFVETPARTAGRTRDEQGRPLRRTMGIASLGGATLDNEENYLIKKLFTAAGAIQIENQARI